jgi:phosphate transport system substrate-binding protein
MSRPEALPAAVPARREKTEHPEFGPIPFVPDFFSLLRIKEVVMKKTILVASVLAFVAMGGVAGAQSARSHISIVGSSTVYPFATVVAEQFGRGTEFRTPTIESTGSGGGLKLFCEGVGTGFADITNASRRIKKSECENCAKNGVAEIIEVKVGYDGITIANSRKGPVVNLTPREIYLALAKSVPAPGGEKKLVPNFYRTWAEINPDLPATAIEVLGPPPTSGTRDAFVELVMDKGAATFDWIKAMEKKEFRAASRTLREDGGYVEAGENDNLIVQKLDTNPDAFGIFGFSFLDQNADVIQGVTIDGVAPTFENIASGDYPVSRPLFFYVKKAHVDAIPGMQEYLAEFTSEKAWGPDGYLADKGMIPMPDAERKQFADAVKNLTPLSCGDL